MGHFSATQTETRQKEQNRVVAPAGGRGPITGLEETLDLLRLKGLGQSESRQFATEGTEAARSVEILPCS